MFMPFAATAVELRARGWIFWDTYSESEAKGP
jgi:hypothetical protein